MNRNRRKELDLIINYMYTKYEQRDEEVFAGTLLAIECILQDEQESYKKLPRGAKEGLTGKATNDSIEALKLAFKLINELVYSEEEIDTLEYMEKISYYIMQAQNAYWFRKFEPYNI